MIQITLAAARVNAGFTQTQAAHELGVTKTTILNWEKGRTEPKATQMDAISKVYGISKDAIFLK